MPKWIMIKEYIGLTLPREGVRTCAADWFRFTAVPLMVLTLLTVLCLGIRARQEGMPASTRAQARLLNPDEIVTENLKGGQTNAYRLALVEREYVHIVVEQQGIDVVVGLFDPAGNELVKMDSPNGRRGPEAVSEVAQFSGHYTITVTADEKQLPGRYELRLEGPREAGAGGGRRVTAERLFAEGQKLALSRTRDALFKAVAQQEKALEIWRELGDVRQEAYTLCGLGQTHKSLGQFREAIDYLKRAFSRLSDLRDVAGQAFMLNELGATERDLGDPLAALEDYDRALKLRTEIGDQWGEAQLHNNIGYLYSKIGQQQKAIDNFGLALALWRALGDRGMELNTVNNIAKARVDLGNLTEAFGQFQELVAASDQSGETRLKPFLENSLGLIYDTWGEPQEALDKYETALTLFRKAQNQEGEAIVLDNIGMVYASLGDAPRALNQFQEALKFRQELNDPGGESVTRSNMGYAQQLLGNRSAALAQLKQALGLSQRSLNQTFEAYTRVRIGEVYFSQGDTAKALESYLLALDLQKQIEDRRGQAITLDKIGEVQSQLGESARAFESYREALGRWISLKDLQGQALSLYGIARVARQQNKLAEARDSIEEATKIVESLRTKPSSQQLRLTYFATRHNYYELDIDTRMRLYDLDHARGDMEAALSISERARARNLLDLLAEAHAPIDGGSAQQYSGRRRDLQRDVGALEERLLRLRNLRRKEDAEVVEDRLSKLIAEQDELEGKIRAASTAYAQLQQQPLGPREIQALLDGQTIVLEYSLADERSYLWVITNADVSAFSLPGRAEIERAAEGFQRALTAYEPPNPKETNSHYVQRLTNAAVEYPQRALELSRILLGPLSSRLANKRLVIVADGALQYVPFGALPAPFADRGQRKLTTADLVPLILKHEIVYQPSASALALLRTIPRLETTRTLAVLADPVFDSADARVRNASKNAGTPTTPATPFADFNRALRDAGDIGSGETEFKLERLRYSADEANAIVAVAAPGSWMKALDFAASRSAALDPQLRQFKIVHFATHGILNARHPELSGIVLSMVDERGQPENGFLGLGDIYNLHLPIDLVVLSSCQTAIGKQVRGEGLIGLTRGFMYAGAARVIASLWRVDDEATAELMKRFYTHMLNEKLPAAAALRQAQLELRETRDQWRAPYYWAGFVLQGEWK